MKKIYVSSQDFGFGPTSNLFSIMRYLKSKSNNFEIYAVKNESIEIFYQINVGVIDHIVECIDYKNVDLVFSSFDPFVILESWLNNIPSIFYCNLFWYWDVYSNLSMLDHYKAKLEGYKNNNEPHLAKKYFLEIFSNNPHEGIFMGFMLSNKCFTRKFPKVESYLGLCKNITNISLFDIYIPCELTSNASCKKNKILFQLSGSRNPVVNFNENIIYVSLCIKLAKHLAAIFTELEFLICINPLILKSTNSISSEQYSNIKIISSISQCANLAMMEDSLAIFTSPGLETIYESIYASCPAFLLPEQNGGQYSIFQMLSSSGYSPARYLINEEFKNRDKLPGEEDAHAIYNIIENQILSCDERMCKLVNNAQYFITLMMDNHERIKYLDMSLNSIKINENHNPFIASDPVSDYIVQEHS